MCTKKNPILDITVKPHLREERRKIMKNVDLRHQALMNMLNGWNGKGEKDVTKKQMRTFPIGVWQTLSKGVKIRRRKDLPNDTLVFDTIMEEGGEFGLHKHSDCVEVVDVLEGEFVDMKTNTTYETGEQVVWPKGVEHIPVAVELTELVVYFI